jgi:hypothetical protein
VLERERERERTHITGGAQAESMNIYMDRPSIQEEGCLKSAIGDTGACIAHGGGRRCQEEGCTNSLRVQQRRLTMAPQLAQQIRSIPITPSAALRCSRDPAGQPPRG